DVRLEFGVSGCAPSGAPFPSGTVQIFDGGTLVNRFTLIFNSLTQGTVGSCSGGMILRNGSPPSVMPTVAGVGAGTHSYTAVYSGDAFYASSTSPPIAVTIPARPTAVPTATTLSFPTRRSSDLDVRLEFGVSGCAPSGAPFPSGTVQIFD